MKYLEWIISALTFLLALLILLIITGYVMASFSKKPSLDEAIESSVIYIIPADQKSKENLYE